MSAKGLGITQADMEASRLVFVSVKDAKIRRKVAIPVPDNYTWENFIAQIQTKLKIAGVESVYLASSGEKVTSLDSLQDIDELHVIESQVPPPVNAAEVASSNPASFGRDEKSGVVSISGMAQTAEANRGEGQAGPMMNGGQAHQYHSPGQLQSHASLHRIVSADDEAGPVPGARDTEGDSERKYAKRSSGVRRSLQRAFPGLFRSGLPVTSRDVREEGGRLRLAETRSARPGRRRRTRGLLRPWNLLLLTGVMAFLLVLTVVYNRILPQLP